MAKEKPKIEEMANRLKRILSYYSSHSIIYEAGKRLKKGSKEAEEQLRQFLDESVEDRFLAFCWLYEERLKKGNLEEKTKNKMDRFEVDPINSLIAREAKKAIETKEKMLKRIFN